MARPEWINLNGLWDYAIVAAAPIPDASGHRHTGNVAGAPVWKEAGGPAAGGAMEFDGVRDFIQIPRVVQDDFTIAFWVKVVKVDAKQVAEAHRGKIAPAPKLEKVKKAAL